MVERFAIAGANQRDLVRLRPDVRKQFGNLHPGLSLAIKLPWTAAHRRLTEIDSIRLQALRRFRRDALTAALRQLRLRIERVHVAHAAVHEQIDDALRLRGLVRRPSRASGFRESACSIEASATEPKPRPACISRSRLDRCFIRVP